MNGLKEAFSRENLLKNLNFFALLNLGLVLTARRFSSGKGESAYRLK